jgi:hypothetical protein
VYKQVYYEAGFELKGEDKHAAYIKQIGLLFENIQLVDPTAIMHASIESAPPNHWGPSQRWATIWQSSSTLPQLAEIPMSLNPRRTTIKRKDNRERWTRHDQP